MIPVVRTQTLHEYYVWRKNAEQQLSYAYVEEPRIFEMLHEVYQKCNCLVYEHFTGEKALLEIAVALDSVILEGATGVVQHVTLSAGEGGALVVPKSKSETLEVPLFSDGKILSADDLNCLYQAVVSVAKMHGMKLVPAITWESGQTLKATQLNALLDDVVSIYKFCGLTIPVWSFRQFQEGHVLRASHLNEIGNRLLACA